MRPGGLLMTFLDRPEGQLAIALAVGLVIGAERERRKADTPRATAGLRTFALVGLLGGVVGLIGGAALLVVVAAVVGGMAIVGYYRGDRADPGLTTEAALVLTYCLGALAIGAPKVALAAGLAAATLLAFRTTLHSAVRSVLSGEELRDALLFGVAAVVVLPLVPNRTIDPLGVINPFTLWRLVVVLMAMSGAGYVAQRAIGPRYGLALAGFGSGFVSSAATIAAMGARARAEPELLRPAVAGAAAST
ncbi:MAG TPA: MgtC/SapB family protein, partial [Polyangia bacterium]